MAVIDRSELELQLRELFGDGFVPGNRNGFVGTVSPRDAAELRKLVLCTSESKVQLTPRGADSSPFHGAHTDHGVAVTFDQMDRILNVDVQAQTAKVEPGVTWKRLSEHLWPRGLMPRVYPSSGAFSTVGGFVAQGGVGVGSFQYGPIEESVAAVRMLTADGQAMALHGPALDLAIGVEGRTGLLTEILLRLQPVAVMEPLVAVFGQIGELEACLGEVIQRGLPLWSVGIMDRAAVDLQARKCSPFDLPAGRYAALFSFRRTQRMQVLPRLRGAILASGGQITTSKGSHDLWVDRFMSLQALGTTPVPMQFRVPLGKLQELLRSTPRSLRRRLAFEATVVDAAFVVTRVFLTETATDNTDVARELLRLAKQVGGETYATGRFFLDEAAGVYGSELLGRLEQFRHSTDPFDRLNPGAAFS